MFFQVIELVKKNKRDFVLFVLIFLVSTISFALGYLFAFQTDHTPIVIEKHSP